MRFQFLIFSTILIFTVILTGCPTAAPTTNGNSTAPPTNAANNSGTTNSSLETVKKTPEQTTNNAPTLAPVFKAYCDAMTKKDEAALRKVYAQATLKYLEQQMKEEKAKTLLEYMETEQVSNKLCEVRNEKIDGNVGIAEVKTEGMPNGAKIKFVKENGEWKLTTDSPEVKSVKDSVTNSNMAK